MDESLRSVGAGRPPLSSQVELESVPATESLTQGVTTLRALAYEDVVGSPEVGDVVLLNVTALDLELGTGGYALVAGIPDRLPADPEGPGHLVKARYTPLQMTVLGVDEQDSPHHDLLRDADDLAGMPVVVADLHSALPAIIAGLRERHARCEGRLRGHRRWRAAVGVLPHRRRVCVTPDGSPGRSRSARPSAAISRR